VGCWGVFEGGLPCNALTSATIVPACVCMFVCVCVCVGWGGDEGWGAMTYWCFLLAGWVGLSWECVYRKQVQGDYVGSGEHVCVCVCVCVCACACVCTCVSLCARVHALFCFCLIPKWLYLQVASGKREARARLPEGGIGSQGQEQDWPEPYIHTAYDRIFDKIPAKNVVCTLCILYIWFLPTLGKMRGVHTDRANPNKVIKSQVCLKYIKGLLLPHIL